MTQLVIILKSNESKINPMRSIYYYKKVKLVIYTKKYVGTQYTP